MRKLIISAALLAASSAFASDLPSRKAPIPVPTPDASAWTGAYAGLFGGGLFGGHNGTLLATGDAGAVSFVGAPQVPTWTPQPWGASIPVGLNDGGAVVGGTLGYNAEFGKLVVVGVEADGGALFAAQGNSGSLISSAVSGIPTYIQVGRAADWVGTVRARAGFLLTSHLLAYGTAGLALGHANATVGTYSSAMQATYLPAHTGTVRAGWTAGGGVEWMFAQNWSAKLEYLYSNLGTATIETGAIAGFGPWTGVQSALVKAPFSASIVKTGVNYHFNWSPTPIILN